MSEEQQFDDLHGESFAKIGLSLVAMIVLIIWFDAAKEFGTAQIFAIVALHVVSIVILVKAAKEKSVSLFMFGLAIPFLWNTGGFIYTLSLLNDSFTMYLPDGSYVRYEPPRGQAAGAAFLAFTIGQTIYKANKLKSLK